LRVVLVVSVEALICIDDGGGRLVGKQSDLRIEERHQS